MKNNSINSESLSLTTDTFILAGTIITASTGLNVLAGGADIVGNSIINGGTVDIGTDAATNAINIGTVGARAVKLGSTTALATTTIQAPSGGMVLTGVQGVAVSNRNYVTINTATGAIGSDAAPLTSISITGDTGGALTGSSFTFTGGTTGLSFGGSGSTETLTFAGITANGGTVSLATDATTSTINVGTGGGVKTSTFGSVTSTSATTVQSGSGALNITSTNGAITMNSGTGTVGIGTDATAATYNFATGAGAKLVTLGTTNGASSLALKTGTADFSLASATGTIMSALDTGEVTFPLQSAFLATNSSQQTDVTGNNTAYTLQYTTEVFDQNSDYDGTSTFTAPVTGKYGFKSTIILLGLTSSHTESSMVFITSNRNYLGQYFNPFANSISGVASTFAGNTVCDMDAADTATMQITVNGGTKVVDIQGNATNVYFSGYLAC